MLNEIEFEERDQIEPCWLLYHVCVVAKSIQVEKRPGSLNHIAAVAVNMLNVNHERREGDIEPCSVSMVRVKPGRQITCA